MDFKTSLKRTRRRNLIQSKIIIYLNDIYNYNYNYFVCYRGNIMQMLLLEGMRLLSLLILKRRYFWIPSLIRIELCRDKLLFLDWKMKKNLKKWKRNNKIIKNKLCSKKKNSYKKKTKKLSIKLKLNLLNLLRILMIWIPIK